MKKLLILSLIFFCHTVYGQTTPVSGSMTLELKNDTLFSNTGLKFFVGQQLSIGNAAGEKAYYRSVIYKNAAIVPSIWGQDMRFENAIENHVNKKKSREKVKSTLLPGNFVTIKKISLWKNSKPNFYLIALTTDSDSYYCDIKLAVELKELELKQ